MTLGSFSAAALRSLSFRSAATLLPRCRHFAASLWRCNSAASLLPTCCQVAETLLPCFCPSAATLLPRCCRSAATQALLGCYSAATPLPPCCHVVATVLPLRCRSAASLLPPLLHVYCMYIASLLPICCHSSGNPLPAMCSEKKAGGGRKNSKMDEQLAACVVGLSAGGSPTELEASRSMGSSIVFRNNQLTVMKFHANPRTQRREGWQTQKKTNIDSAALRWMHPCAIIMDDPGHDA